jgi:hypothetical protein
MFFACVRTEVATEIASAIGEKYELRVGPERAFALFFMAKRLGNPGR